MWIQSSYSRKWGAYSDSRIGRDTSIYRAPSSQVRMTPFFYSLSDLHCPLLIYFISGIFLIAHPLFSHDFGPELQCIINHLCMWAMCNLSSIVGWLYHWMPSYFHLHIWSDWKTTEISFIQGMHTRSHKDQADFLEVSFVASMWEEYEQPQKIYHQTYFVDNVLLMLLLRCIRTILQDSYRVWSVACPAACFIIWY